MSGDKESPKKIKSVLKTRATKKLQEELDIELEDDCKELSVAELLKRGKLEKNKFRGA